MEPPASDRAAEPADPPADVELVRHTWVHSDRVVPRTVVRPIFGFLDTVVGAGVLMVAAAVAALVWANSPWSDSYFELWGTHLSIELGDIVHLDHLTLRDWVNDALMTVFFFLMALEIKQERSIGELRDPRAAALPAIAALGGMLVPAAIFLALNAGGDAANGWGIPMATDIAFAVGVVALAGPRVPLGARVFLLTLAVVDDIGAILVIAVFYTSDLSVAWLVIALGALAAAWVVQRIDIRHLGVYVACGVVAWYALLESGVHATLAGVAMGLLTPAFAFNDPRHFGRAARTLVDEIDEAFVDGTLTAEELEHNEGRIQELIRIAREATSPIATLTNRLGPWVSYAIVPIFAFANAGVKVAGDTAADAAGEPVVLGIVLGLVVGKTVGVFSATWLAVRTGVGRLPSQTTWRHVLGLSVTAGVGFTVALFVAGLAFDDPNTVDLAKIGILSGSLIAGVIGFTLLRTSPPSVVVTGAVSDGDDAVVEAV